MKLMKLIVGPSLIISSALIYSHFEVTQDMKDVADYYIELTKNKPDSLRGQECIDPYSGQTYYIQQTAYYSKQIDNGAYKHAAVLTVQKKGCCGLCDRKIITYAKEGDNYDSISGHYEEHPLRYIYQPVTVESITGTTKDAIKKIKTLCSIPVSATKRFWSVWTTISE